MKSRRQIRTGVLWICDFLFLLVVDVRVEFWTGSDVSRDFHLFIPSFSGLVLFSFYGAEIGPDMCRDFQVFFNWGKIHRKLIIKTYTILLEAIKSEIKGHLVWFLVRLSFGLADGGRLLCPSIPFPWCVYMGREVELFVSSSFWYPSTL